MTSGRRTGWSKIDINHLGQPVLDYRKLGMSYSEIIEEIWKNYKIKLNKANLSSFFNRPENKNPEPEKASDSDTLANLHVRLKKELYDIRKELQNNMERFTIGLDESSLKPIERSNLKKSLKIYERKLFRELDEADNTILNTVSEIHTYVEKMNRLLLEMSEQLCPNCGRIVSEYAEKILEDDDTK